MKRNINKTRRAKLSTYLIKNKFSFSKINQNSEKKYFIYFFL